MDPIWMATGDPFFATGDPFFWGGGALGTQFGWPLGTHFFLQIIVFFTFLLVFLLVSHFNGVFTRFFSFPHFFVVKNPICVKKIDFQNFAIFFEMSIFSALLWCFALVMC